MTQPLFWFRPRSDGGYDGPIHDSKMEAVRKRSGGWVPLYPSNMDSARLAAAEADAERLDWLDRMNSALNSHYGTNYRWKLIMSPNVVRLYAGRGESGYVGALDLCDSNSGRGAKSSVREAIDKARGERNG